MAAAGVPQLTPGGAGGLLAQREGRRGGPLQPVLQVVEYSVFRKPGSDVVRHMLGLTDGADSAVALLTASAMQVMQGPNPLQKGSVVQVQSWECREQKGKMVVFIIDLHHFGCSQPDAGLAPAAPMQAAAPAPAPGGTDAEMQRFLASQAQPPAAAAPQGLPAQAGFLGGPHAQAGPAGYGNAGPPGGGSAAPQPAPGHAAPNPYEVQPRALAPHTSNPYEAQPVQPQPRALAPHTSNPYEAPTQPGPAGPNPYELGGIQREVGAAGAAGHPVAGSSGGGTAPAAWQPGAGLGAGQPYGGAPQRPLPLQQQQQPQQQQQQQHQQQQQQQQPQYSHQQYQQQPQYQQYPQQQRHQQGPPAAFSPFPGQASAQPRPPGGYGGAGGAAAPPWAAQGSRAPLPGQAQGAAGGTQEPLTPIAELTVYKPRWRIEARVTKKNTIRTFQYRTKEGEGQLFSIELLDRAGGETRGTFFGEMAERYHQFLVEGKMYSFARGKLKKANSQYYTRGPLEITFDEGCCIEEVPDDNSCAKNTFEFSQIMALKDKPPQTAVDLAAVISDAEGVSDCPLKKGGSKPRHNITLLDDSGASIRLTLWGDQASDPRLKEAGVVILKGVKVSDYGGVSLSTNFSTQLYLEGEAEAAHPRAGQLRRWYATSGAEAKHGCEALSRGGGHSAPLTLAELQQEALSLELPGGAAEAAGSQTQQQYHTVAPATITFFHSERQPFYWACPFQNPDDRNPGKTRSCFKKVEGGGPSMPWTCALGHECERPTARWMATFAVADHTGVQYVSGFDETLEKVFGSPAQEFATAWDNKGSDPAAQSKIEEMFKASQFTSWRMRLRAKKEFWNDEERLKVSIVEADKLNFAQVGRQKLAEVRASLAPRAGPADARSGGA